VSVKTVSVTMPSRFGHGCDIRKPMKVTSERGRGHLEESGGRRHLNEESKRTMPASVVDKDDSPVPSLWVFLHSQRKVSAKLIGTKRWEMWRTCEQVQSDSMFGASFDREEAEIKDDLKDRP
jgi:hypothetical protein